MTPPWHRSALLVGEADTTLGGLWPVRRSAFDGVDGLTKTQRRRLLERFRSVRAVAAAGAHALAAAADIDMDLATAVDRHLREEGNASSPGAGGDAIGSGGAVAAVGLSAHAGPGFHSSGLLLNGRRNVTVPAGYFGVRRSRNRCLLLAAYSPLPLRGLNQRNFLCRDSSAWPPR